MKNQKDWRMNAVYPNSDIREDVNAGLYGLALEALRLAESNSPCKRPEEFYEPIKSLGGECDGEVWSFRDGSSVADSDYDWVRSGGEWS